jgi:hypothetical protein
VEQYDPWDPAYRTTGPQYPGSTMCSVFHSVAPVRDQQGWGNVMYIPAAPWCPRNERYAVSVEEACRTGSSPGDFPPEHYERSWPNRG